MHFFRAKIGISKKPDAFLFSLQRDKELADRFLLKPAPFYNYLNQSGSITLDGVDDADKFDALRLAFEVVQIPPPIIEGILSVLSAILWLGNLKFAGTYRFCHSFLIFFILKYFSNS